MKRLFAIVLSLVLVFSLNMTAFATENVNTDGGSVDATVTGTYVESTADVQYSVDIAWSGLVFTYSEGVKEWNASTHQYDVTGAGWAESDAKIVITNHSNAAIEATPSWSAAAGFESTSMKFYEGENETASITLDSAAPAEGEEAGTATTGTIIVQPNGTLTSSADGGTIGYITVKITSVN